MMIQPADLIACQLYQNETDVWRDAVRALTWLRPEFKLEVAVRRYSAEEVSLAKAAQIAGLAFEEMKELLVRRGVEVRLGPETTRELDDETDVLRASLGEPTR